MKRQFLALGILAVCLVALSLPQVIHAQAATLTVWHAWAEPRFELVRSYVEKNFSGSVEWTAFESPNALYNALLNAPVGESPDVFIGDHTWGADLLEHKIVGAYCLPDSTVCSVCEGANPPRWCLYAKGQFEEVGLVKGFEVGQGTRFADDDRCGNEPRKWPFPIHHYCEIVTGPFKLDLFQSAFSRVVPMVEPMPIPNGVPSDWDMSLIYVIKQRILDAGFDVPVNMGQLNEIATKAGYANLTPTSLVALNPQPLPPLEGNVELNKASIFVLPASMVTSPTFADFQKAAGGELELLPLADYHPGILVSGAYISANAKSIPDALDLGYLLTDDELQVDLFKAMGILPTNAEAIESVLSENTAAKDVFDIAASQGLLAYPMSTESAK